LIVGVSGLPLLEKTGFARVYRTARKLSSIYILTAQYRKISTACKKEEKGRVETMRDAVESLFQNYVAGRRLLTRVRQIR